MSRGNGNGPINEAAILAAAIEAENATGDEAAAIRGDATELTPALYMQLVPLLRRPIPAGFIKSVGVVTGKPYASTGVRSVQVQINRMDNVLTGLWWRETSDYSLEGKLCEVTVSIGNPDGPVLVSRSSMGGVDRGSTQGNIRKGSYTNAAKVAFARIGPGHEVYLGAVDLDPDVHEETARQQDQPQPSGTKVGQYSADDKISRERATELMDAVWVWELQTRLPLALAHITGQEYAEFAAREDAVTAALTLTSAQSVRLDGWINKQAKKAQEAASV